MKAFLKAGILTEDGTLADTSAGSPQGSILSPLLSNVALSVLDEFIAQDREAPEPARMNGLDDAARVCPTTGSAGMRTTGASQWRAPRRMPEP